MEETIELFISFIRDIKQVSENTSISYKRDLIKMSQYFKSRDTILRRRLLRQALIHTYCG